MLNFLQNEIDPKEYPSATELSHLAIELSKSSRKQEKSLDSSTIKKALALWENSYIILHERILSRSKTLTILKEKFGEVPHWPDSQKVNISYDKFKKLIGGTSTDEVFGKAMLYFYFFMLHCEKWANENILAFEVIGLNFDKDKGTVKYSTLMKLAEKNGIDEDLHELYAIYLSIEAQKGELQHLEEDPLNLDSSIFNLINLLKAKSEVTEFTKRGCDKIHHELMFTAVFYFLRFYDELKKHLGRSSRTNKKQK